MPEKQIPYKNNSELPDSVKDNLPGHGQDIYREAYNSAWEEYKDPSERKGGFFKGRNGTQGCLECG